MNNFPVIFHYDEVLDRSFYGRDLIFEKGSFSGPKTVPVVVFRTVYLREKRKNHIMKGENE